MGGRVNREWKRRTSSELPPDPHTARPARARSHWRARVQASPEAAGAEVSDFRNESSPIQCFRREDAPRPPDPVLHRLRMRRPEGSVRRKLAFVCSGYVAASSRWTQPCPDDRQERYKYTANSPLGSPHCPVEDDDLRSSQKAFKHSLVSLVIASSLIWRSVSAMLSSNDIDAIAHTADLPRRLTGGDSSTMRLISQSTLASSSAAGTT